MTILNYAYLNLHNMSITGSMLAVFVGLQAALGVNLHAHPKKWLACQVLVLCSDGHLPIYYPAGYAKFVLTVTDRNHPELR